MRTKQGRIRRIQGAIFGWIRHPEAAAVSMQEATDWDAELLRGKYCTLVTYRADGTSVPTPVWIARDGDRVFLRTGSDAFKVKRIRRTPEVLLAPSTRRGKPTAAPMRGHARVLAEGEEPVAERALRARHGLLRRFYSTTVDDHLPTVYIEIGPRPEPR